MAKILKVDNKIKDLIIDKKDSMKQMQDIVGGYFELLFLPDNKILIVNEEGRLCNLPLNPQATKLYKSEIVGDVILCTYDEIEDEEEEY